jgi:uncharacterized protein (DUF58 family)
MIVPRTKLIGWTAGLVLPFTLLGAVEPATLPLSVSAIGALAALVVFDAFRAMRGLSGISLELPRLARMSKDRPSQLEVRIRNERQQPRTLRVALAFPWAIHSTEEDFTVRLPSETEWSRFVWPCRPLQRGKFFLGIARVETSSSLGFWDARQTVPTVSEIRVYPDLLSERRELAALFLHRGPFGFHAQRQVGKGREFEKLREYVPGDDFDEIHWKATARRGRPITKVFQIERTQAIYVIIDASRLSARRIAAGGESGGASPAPATSPSGTALERFITAGLVLGLAAEQQGDLFGLVTFTNKIDRFVRARNGQAHFSACRDALYQLEPQLVSPDYDEVCTFIRLRLRRRSLLVFLTALDDPVLAESFVRNLELLRRQHLVLVNMLPPPGVSAAFSDPNVDSVDDLYERLGGHLLWQKLRELDKVLQRRGVQFSLLKNERLSAQLVNQYLNVKRKQAL